MAAFNIDDILKDIGDLGRFQKIAVFLLCLVVLPSAFHTYIPLFILSTPSHRCALDNVHNDSWSVQGPDHMRLINSSVPIDQATGEWSACFIKRSRNNSVDNVGEVVSGERVESNMTRAQPTGNMESVDTTEGSDHDMMQCDRWVYDQEFFSPSLVEKFDLVCDRKTIRTHANMAMMVGKLAAGLLLGIVSDIFGRKKILMFLICTMIVASIINIFLSNIIHLIFGRLLAGFTTTSIYIACYILGMEFLSPSWRRLYSLIISVFWILGGFLITGVAFFLRDWRDLSIAVAAPGLLLISYFWLIYESPRWLLTKGRKEEAKDILKTIARVNGAKFREDDFVKMDVLKHDVNSKIVVIGNNETDGGSKNQSTDNVFSILKYKIMIIRLGILIINWIVNSLVYYALMFNTVNMAGSIYLNFFLFNCVDLVANVATYFIVDKFGRKMCYCGFLLVAVVACLASVFPCFLLEGAMRGVVINILALLGRGCISASYNIIYLYSAELFPTTLRNTLMGTCSFSSKIGSMSGPYIADLGVLLGGKMNDILPLVVCGGSGFFAFLLMLFIPETVGLDLPSTLHQASQIGRKSRKIQDHDVAENQQSFAAKA